MLYRALQGLYWVVLVRALLPQSCRILCPKGLKPKPATGDDVSGCSIDIIEVEAKKTRSPKTNTSS